MTASIAFLQELDVVRVAPDRVGPRTLQENLLRAVRMTKLAAVVYDGLSLHPWQAFDHPLLRPAGGLDDLLAGPESPARFFWPSDQPTFQSCLEHFLRRRGEGVFVFSSVPDSVTVARTWGDKVDPNWTRNDLFEHAARHHDDYAQFVECAVRYDERKVRIVKSELFSYDAVLAECSNAGVAFTRPPEWPDKWWPKSRSAAVKDIQKHAADQQLRVHECMAPYDRVYNIALAGAYSAIPVASFDFDLDQATRFIEDRDGLDSRRGSSGRRRVEDSYHVEERLAASLVLADHWTTQAVALRERCQVIQFNYYALVSKYQEFAEQLDRVTVTNLLRICATSEVSRHVASAWSSFHGEATQEATKHFNRAFETLWELLSRQPTAIIVTPRSGDIKIGPVSFPAAVADDLVKTVRQAAATHGRQLHGLVMLRTEPPER